MLQVALEIPPLYQQQERLAVAKEICLSFSRGGFIKSEEFRNKRRMSAGFGNIFIYHSGAKWLTLDKSWD